MRSANIAMRCKRLASCFKGVRAVSIIADLRCLKYASLFLSLRSLDRDSSVIDVQLSPMFFSSSSNRIQSTSIVWDSQAAISRSVSRIVSVICVNNAFATHGGTALPICLLMLVTPLTFG